MAAEAAIEVQELTKTFDKLTAVDEISFRVESGEIFGFLGPNGAGKTTSVRMITGVIPPDTGDIYIAGNNLRTNPLTAKMKLGVAPELANAYTDLTALENVLFIAGMYGLSGPEVKSRAENLLRKFGLDNRRHEKVKNFSKGMAQRVVLCMALINEPEILFLDEPTSGLDVQSSRLIRNVIQELNRRGTTIFLTTHNIHEANQLCEQIAIMNKGNIAAIDSPVNLKRLFESSRSVEVAVSPLDKAPDFKNLSAVEKVEKRGDKLRLYTPEPGCVIKEVVNQIEATDLTLRSLNTLGPSLEEVFVSVTGGDIDVS